MKKLLFVFLCIICVSMHPKPAADTSTGNILGIRLTYTMPLGNWDASLQDFTSSYEVYYYNEMTMYKFPFTYDSVVNGELKLEEKRFSYFVFRKDSTYGKLLIPQRPDISNRRLRVDSVLHGKLFETILFDTLAKIKADSSFVDREKNTIKIYKFPVRANDLIDYTVYLYYTEKLKDIPETFSKEMDQQNRAKLFRIRGIPGKALKPGLPVHEVLYEMSEIEIANKEQLFNYFNAGRAPVIQ